MNSETIWLAVGFLGQVMFSMRFIIQWVASERRRRSYIPVAFWFFSIAGGSILLSYAVWRLDPVFIAGQAGGLVIYARNLHFIWREHRQAKTEPAAKS